MQKNGLGNASQELAASEAHGKAESHRVEVEGREAERYLWRCLGFFDFFCEETIGNCISSKKGGKVKPF